MTTPLALLVLVGPVMLVASAVVALAGHGPAGWLAAAGFLAAVVAATWWSLRAVRRWWASTKAPEHSHPVRQPRQP